MTMENEKNPMVEEMVNRFRQWFSVVMLFIEKILPLGLTVEQVQDLLKNKDHPFWIAFNEATKLLVPQPIVTEKASGASSLKPIDYLPTLDDCLTLWPEFCKEFGLAVEVDFEALKSDPRVANRKTGFDWVIYCPKGFTAKQAFDLCKRVFKKVWEGIAIEEYSYERRPEKTDLVLCKATVEPDKEWLNTTSDEMSAETSAKGIQFLDHRERYMLEAFYYWLTKRLTGKGRHLDIKGWTRCPGSRGAGGGVADAGWFGGGFEAGWGDADGRDPRAGGRETVSLLP